MAKRTTDGLVELKVAAAQFGMATKRLRRWVRLYKLGRPQKNAEGHYVVDTTRVAKLIEQAKAQAAMAEMKWDDEKEE